MEDFISPKYQMSLINKISAAIISEYKTWENIEYYISKWHIPSDNWNNQEENFTIKFQESGVIHLDKTLHNIDSNLLLEIAIDIGVETPNFIPSRTTFINEIKSDYKTAQETFEKAFKQIESHPDIAIGLANSALESIMKEILKDDSLTTKYNKNKTLYELTGDLLKEFQMFPSENVPSEIKMIGSSLLTISQSIERLRSESTNMHGKTNEDYIVSESIYAYFIINSITTIGLFLNSFYKTKFPKKTEQSTKDDLPF